MGRGPVGAPALVKYNDQSISAITDIAASAKDAMVLIKTVTASSSATVSFVDGSDDVVLDNTYPIYRFVWINAHASDQSGDGSELAFDVSINTGSDYDTIAKCTTYFVSIHAENDATPALAYTAAADNSSGTGTQYLSVDNDADNDASNSGEMWLFNPSDTTYVKHFIAKNNYMHSNPSSTNNFVGGYLNTTSAIDALQFSFTGSTTIESGTFKLYGIKDS